MVLGFFAILIGSICLAKLQQGRRVSRALTLRLVTSVLVIGSVLQGALAFAGGQEIQRPRSTSTGEATPEPCERFLSTNLPSFEETKRIFDVGQTVPTQNMPASSATEVLVRIEKHLAKVRGDFALVFAVAEGLRNYDAKKKAFDSEFADLTLQMGLIDGTLRSAKQSGRDFGPVYLKLDQLLQRKEDLLNRLDGMAFAEEVLPELRNHPQIVSKISSAIGELSDLTRPAIETGRGGGVAEEIRRMMTVMGYALNVIHGTERAQAQILINEVGLQIQKLWVAQSAAVRAASATTNKYEHVPIDHALDDVFDGLGIYGQGRGDITRTPKNEIVLINSWMGYRLRYVSDEFEKSASGSVRSAFSRSQVALLDPDIEINGISRGMFLKNSKEQKFAVLGFFPNSDVAVQTLPEPGTAPKILVWKLPEVEKMNKEKISNYSRLSLVGDQVVRAEKADRDFNFKVELSSRTNRRHVPTALTAITSVGTSVFVSTVAAYCASRYFTGGELLLDIAGAYLGGVLGILPGLGALNYIEKYMSNWTGLDPAKNPTVVGPWTKSDISDSATGGMRRSADLWINARSLTTEERKALGIETGEWLVSPSGETVKAVTE